MGLTISGFWTALIMISAMSSFLFFTTRKNKLYNVVKPTTVIFCGVLILLRVVFPIELLAATDLYIPRIFPLIDTILRYKVTSIENTQISLWMIIFFIWGIVSLKKLYDLIYDYIKILRVVALCEDVPDHLLLYIKRQQEKDGILTKAIKYKISRFQHNPFIVGVFNPTIVLPFYISSRAEDELHMVLQHEWMHYKRKDGITKIILETFSRIFWWLPFIKQIKRKVYEAMEIRADWNVVKNMEENEKTQYMMLLYELCEISGKSYNNNALTNSFIHEQFSTMEKRFVFINEKIEWGLRNILMCIVTIVLFVFSYFILIEPQYTPEEGVPCKYSCYIYEQINGVYDVYMDGEFLATTDDISFINASDFNDIQVKIFKEDEKR
ncbi:M56 family metallopeptidase [Blautia schinkii]|nr:M56 family metallopeptidase [Blautia schinkii]